MKKNKFNIICRYCRHFQTSPDRNLKEHTRKCIVIKKHVNEKTEACKEFSLHKYFHCDREHNRLLVEVCIARQDRSKDGCRKCKQGRMVRNLHEKVDKPEVKTTDGKVVSDIWTIINESRGNIFD